MSTPRVRPERQTAHRTPSATAHAPGKLNRFISRYALLLAWAIVIVFFSVLPQTAGVFPTLGNFATILGSNAVVACLALAIIVPLITGDYDLSVANNLTLSGVVLAHLNVNMGWPILPAIAVALVLGALIGLVNAAIILYFRVDSLIVTLGMGTFLAGVSLWVSNANTVSGVARELVNWVIIERLFGIPISFYYVLVLGIIMWFVFEYTPLGRRMLIVGRGRSVAKLSGIRVERVRGGSFVVSGLISAFGGVIYVGTTGAADPTSGAAFLLPAFAAAFLGATAIYPGRFNPLGALAAVGFLGTGIAGFQLLGAQSFVQQLFYGGALVIAVALAQLARKRKTMEAGAG